MTDSTVSNGSGNRNTVDGVSKPFGAASGPSTSAITLTSANSPYTVSGSGVSVTSGPAVLNSYAANFAPSLLNLSTIVSSAAGSQGILIEVGNSTAGTLGGTIINGAVNDTGALISGERYGIQFKTGSAFTGVSLTNFGTIENAGVNLQGNQAGVVTDKGIGGTIDNHGVISSTGGSGVFFYTQDSNSPTATPDYLNNSGTIIGALGFGSVFVGQGVGAATIINTGSIAHGIILVTGAGLGTVVNNGSIGTIGGSGKFANDAIYDGSKGLLDLTPGQSIGGGVASFGSGSTLELSGTAGSVGSLANPGSYIGFTSATVATGADWTIGTSTAAVSLSGVSNVTDFGTLNLAGSLAGATIGFGAAGGGLLDVTGSDVSSGTIGNAVSNFGPNDTIVIGTASMKSAPGDILSESYNSTTGQLDITDHTSGATFAVNVAGTTGSSLVSGNFAVSANASGIVITEQTADFVFNGTTNSNWFTGTNWNGGTSPGTLINSGQTVTIPTGTASIGGTAVTDNGTIAVTGSTTALTDTTSMAGNGTISIDNGAQVTLSNPTGNDSSLTVDFGTHGTTLAPNVFDVNGNTLGFGGTIAGFGPNDQIVLGNATEPTPPSTADVSLTFNSATGELTVTDTAGGSIVTESLHLTGTFDTTPQNTLYDAVGPNGITIQVPCFVEGTRILTSRGEVAVEALSVGDRVITARDGVTAIRRIQWIGHRSIALDRHADRSLVEPVRIRAGAFGAHKPSRDLWVSPDHAIFVDGVLIEAKYLVNGVSIRRDTKARQVTYYHVELDRHDVLIAEGLTAESYISDGNRGMFANSGAPVVLHPDFATPLAAERCAPLVCQGAAIEAVRATLRDRLIANGFTTTDAPEVALIVNGDVIAPMASEAGTLRFALPDGATAATLHVATAAPADTDLNPDDRRQIGVKLVEAAILAGLQRQVVDLTRFDGLFAADQGDGQWSRGEVGIDLTGVTGTGRVLELRYSAAITRWVAPVAGRRAIG